MNKVSTWVKTALVIALVFGIAAGGSLLEVSDGKVVEISYWSETNWL